MAAAPKQAGGEGLDESTLASAIGNGEDLGTIVRAAFEIGRPDALLGQLRGFVRKKEVEIEELCRAHYEEFIRAVDELRNVLVDAELLKRQLRGANGEMQEIGGALLGSVEELGECHAVRSSLALALRGVATCAASVAVLGRVNAWVAEEQLYPALKSLHALERQLLPLLPSSALAAAVDRSLPAFRAHIRKTAARHFNDWLVHVRAVARQVGSRALTAAAAARQRDDELRARQRAAEEQSRIGGGLGVCVLLDMEDDEDDEVNGTMVNDTPVNGAKVNGGEMNDELTPVYRAHYLHECLGLGDDFRAYYADNRRLQLQSDLQAPPGSSLVDWHGAYFAQIAGFFIVEERVLRTGGGVVEASTVDALWETASGRLASLLEEQLCGSGRVLCSAADMLLVKDSVSLLAAALRSYGYAVQPLVDTVVKGRSRERYHELLLQEAEQRMSELLQSDKFEQMLLRKEHEYTASVAAYSLLPPDAPPPAFPYVAPFSASVPDVCRLVRSFLDSSAAFLADTSASTSASTSACACFDAVMGYCDRLLTDVVAAQMVKLVSSPTLGMSQAMQLAANLSVLDSRGADFWCAHAARLCGLPARLAESTAGVNGGGRSALRSAAAAAQERMLELVCSKVDEFMLLTGHIDWTPDDPPQHGNAYLNELVIYLETVAPSAVAILPPVAAGRWLRGVLSHVAASVVATLASEDVRRFNVHALVGLDADVRVLEAFALERGGDELRASLAPARQLINLLLSSQPDLYLNPVIRDKSYSAVQPKLLLAIADKYRDLPELPTGSKLFLRSSSAAAAAARPPNKRKSIDVLVKRLRELV